MDSKAPWRRCTDAKSLRVAHKIIPRSPILTECLSVASYKGELQAMSNTIQENAAALLYQHLRRDISSANLAILSFYADTRDATKRRITNDCTEICTIDGFQGKEADIVVLLTTRTIRSGDATDDFSFLADPQRVTIALSRARHGLFLIGDFELLLQSSTWRLYIDKVAEYTPIFRQSCISQLQCGFERSGEIIVDLLGDDLFPDYSFDQNEQWRR
ncbi:unnamed protein product [Gongylonema pulchrum]|uniref:AAA_12 domain-containing protein n=1 Tax=Gongylonema pulchrum TaxID=637853 RepID=A0A183DPG2_9BILA|nr:unnamed protein product [Gongylonema pulchrum]